MGRLIEAYKLIEAIKKSTCQWPEHLWKQVVCDVINNQPTAYDVEKVVAELEDKYNDIPYQHEMNYKDGCADGLLKAIEIVQKGGVEC